MSILVRPRRGDAHHVVDVPLAHVAARTMDDQRIALLLDDDLVEIVVFAVDRDRPVRALGELHLIGGVDLEPGEVADVVAFLFGEGGRGEKQRGGKDEEEGSHGGFP